MSISISQIKKLREETNAPLMQCRKALEETGGDFAKAKVILRKKGAEVLQKRAGKETKEGVIASYVHFDNKSGALVEVTCETDFVAKNEEFKKLASEIAMQVTASNPKYIRPEDVSDKEIEEKKREFLQEDPSLAGKSKEILDKIIQGKIKKYFEEQSLYKQPLVKDSQKTVEDLICEKAAKLGEKIEVKRFIRYEL